MNVFRSNPQGRDVSVAGDGASESKDPRLQPTPDYGTLGPNSDIPNSYGGSSSPSSPKTSATAGPRRVSPAGLRLLAMTAGVVAALLASHKGASTPLGKIAAVFQPQNKSQVSAQKFTKRDLDRQEPQKQAEILLTRAVGRTDGATDEIQSRVDGWRGRLEWNPQLSQLTTVALNSEDESVRASAIEVQLAAYGLSKSDSTVENLIRQADSSNHPQKIWALWALGLLGNRGVETHRVVEVLTGHVAGSGKDSDEDSRHWAIEGLALVGTASTVAPLLAAMHDDPSALVRERAACSLAQSGMLTHEQRLTAVPQLINYSDDPALDAQTHGWAFQALSDITGQRLPADSAAWRNWYQTASGQ